MSSRKEYLVGVVSWSTNHIWVEATSAAKARAKAEKAWTEDAGQFRCKDGGVDSIDVLDEKDIP